MDDVEEVNEEASEDQIFDFIDNIISNPDNLSASVDETVVNYDDIDDNDYLYNPDVDDSLEDITRVIRSMDLDGYGYTPEKEPETYGQAYAEPTEYAPRNEYERPIYRDDPEEVKRLQEQLTSEKALNQAMLEQTKQLQFQMSEYENEVDDANSRSARVNRILNLVLTLLIFGLFIIIFFIGYWFAKERGLF